MPELTERVLVRPWRVDPKCKCPVRPTPLRHVGAGRLRCASPALLPTDDLTEIFTFQELRRITAQLTVNDKRGLYVLEDSVERRCVRVAPVARFNVSNCPWTPLTSSTPRSYPGARSGATGAGPNRQPTARRSRSCTWRRSSCSPRTSPPCSRTPCPRCRAGKSPPR